MKKSVLTLIGVMGLTACQTPSQSNPAPSAQSPQSAPKTAEQMARKALLDKAVELYQNGDYTQAKSAFIQADTAGHIKAKRYLGLMALNGLGQNKDESQAFDYFKQASENGDITSQYWLGYCYENGIGTTADLKQAIYWYQKSAQRGDHISQPAIDALKRLNVQ